jgi:toxin YoeB
MEEYRIEVNETAKKHLEKIHKTGKKNDVLKIENLISELKIHPRTETGKPEQ